MNSNFYSYQKSQPFLCLKATVRIKTMGYLIAIVIEGPKLTLQMINYVSV